MSRAGKPGFFARVTRPGPIIAPAGPHGVLDSAMAL